MEVAGRYPFLSLFCQNFLYHPGIRKWLIDCEKITPAAVKSAHDVGFRYIVPALADAGRDAPQSKLRRGDAKEHDFNSIPEAFEALKSLLIGASAQRAFKREARARSCQSVNFLKYHPCGGWGASWRAEGPRAPWDFWW